MSRLTPALCAVLLTYSGAALGQTSPDEMARRHFESGAAYLQESDYTNALNAFEKAYELSKRAAILVNIATVHERQGNLQQAVDALEKYLQQEPNGELAETVKLRVSNLKKRLEASARPEAEAPPPVAPDPTPAPPPQQPSPASSPPPAAPAADSQPSRLPAYLFLGVGAAAAGGAVITGLLAQGEYNDAKDANSGCSPTCTDDDLQSGRTLSVVSTVLTGVSLVSVTVGVVLLLTNKSPSEQPVAGIPALYVTAGPTAAEANATWRF